MYYLKHYGKCYLEHCKCSLIGYVYVNPELLNIFQVLLQSDRQILK